MITNATIDLFKQDLWKDHRQLDINTNKTQIKKYYVSREEIETELSVIYFLLSNGVTCVPSIEQIEGTLSARMPYYKGVRIFNLLVELDTISSQCREAVEGIKSQLIKRCEQQQKDIQQALRQWRLNFDKRVTYPHAKIMSIVLILSDCLDIEINNKAIANEIEKINEYWKEVAVVPFRDATTKNILLHNRKLHLSNFESEKARRDYILKSVINGSYQEWLCSPIVNFDFSSCIHDTTPEDDVISLKYHERTWQGRIPSAGDLVWYGDVNSKRSAVSFLIRYFRFGGRKAAYRLIHPSGHRIRFRHDDDSFYFERLPSIMKNLWPECEEDYPNLLSFIKTTANYLKFSRNEIDAFLDAGYGSSRSKYYTDIFDPDI